MSDEAFALAVAGCLVGAAIGNLLWYGAALLWDQCERAWHWWRYWRKP